MSVEQKENALHGGSREGLVEIEYSNDILSMKISVQVFGEPKSEDISKNIALFARRFYLDFFSDKGF